MGNVKQEEKLFLEQYSLMKLAVLHCIDHAFILLLSVHSSFLEVLVSAYPRVELIDNYIISILTCINSLSFVLSSHNSTLWFSLCECICKHFLLFLYFFRDFVKFSLFLYYMHGLLLLSVGFNLSFFLLLLFTINNFSKYFSLDFIQ